MQEDERGIVVRNKARLVAQGYTQEEGIDYDEVFAPAAKIEAIRLFLAYASFMEFIVYQIDVKSAFLYGTINEEVYVDDIIFGSTKKSLCDEFEGLMHKRFQMSFIGELTFFLGLQVQQKDDGIFISQDKYVADILKKFDFATVKTASTPIETNKALVKDEEVEAVDVHLYKSMIGSFMYLIASRPDIMFTVCACARFQVTPKTSHINAVKRIFRYLKGQPNLGHWYPRDSPFDLETFSDSDCAGASLDMKSIIGVLWIQNQMLDYGFNFMNTKIYIDNESTICIVKNLGTDSSSGPRCQDTILRGAKAQSRFEAVSKQSNDPPLSRVNTLGSKEDRMKLMKLMEHYTTLFELIAAKVKTVNEERQLQALVDKKKVIITETSIRSDLNLEDASGTDCLPTDTIFEELAKMGYDKLSSKLTFYKAFFSPQWKFLIHTITQCLSAKTTAWNEFSSTMASAIICLATNQKFNLSKYIFDAMKKQSRRKQKKNTEVPHPSDSTADVPNEEHVHTHSYSKCTTVNAPTTTIDELTLAQTLIEIKAAKPKAVTSAATTTTTTRPKARGVVVQEPSEFKTTSSSLQASQLPQAKDKGKGIMVEPEVPLKKKDQVALDEEMARNLEAQLQAELIEEERLARQKEEEANIALLESWDNTQAMMDADFQLAQQMQTKEQEQLSIEEKSKLFVELLEKRKKHFAALRAQEKRSKPPTKAQKRNQMSTYLKNMVGYKHGQLKSKSYDEIQEMFDKEMKRVNTFVDMNSELVKGSKTKAEGSSKRAGDELEQEKTKKQKGDDDQEEAEMKRHIEIVKDDEVAIDAIPLATKPPVIVDYKIVKEGQKGFYHVIRANGSSKRYSSMIKMLQNIDKKDLETL
ncbi:putative ribonuclease H-like domain-containing protein [Tanacetum coccineum]